MDFEFRELERSEYVHKVEYGAFRDGVEIGHFGLYHYNYDIPEFYVWVTEEGRTRADFHEYVDAALEFLKERGYGRLQLVRGDDDVSDWHSFTLVDRDTSGWDPKYIYYREL